ncbi:type 1 fimbrial protein [Klebsiella huaxiensis]|uniref:Fimbrial protein n=1 Tax=Klebsiella huaxiensis TaxID=2153354 RepID=A0A564KJ92_9ENTR|nr:fimbrial protein [Klebsiella huaxiensis]MDG1640320.1 fimbrial protein [Klebsiella huaxiensis]QBG05769.1 type 1 fimbrial protein [Klebsiella huaxiensis]VUS69412.1 S-fimbrial protein subunit SfaA [Klebsiella huaxiensis]VUS98019.1 S-fimbrial protein subunit SfaA [Klebsiella huaxiensis]
MTMNRALITAALASAIFSGNALAANNTITFMGEVTDETCSVSVNGTDVAPIVLLPTVPASALAASAATAGQTTFDVGVSGCTGSAAGVNISTVFVGNNVSATGNLANTGSAGNVEVQILDTANTDIDFSSVFNGAGDLSLAANETEKTATYTAQYYATGAATAGTVQSSLQYAVSYQ